MRLIIILSLTLYSLLANSLDQQIEALEKRLKAYEDRLLLSHDDTHFTIGGRLQFDAVSNRPSLNLSGGSNTYDYRLSPYSFSDNAPISKLSTSVKNSRLWFKTSQKTSLGILRSIIEVDFWGSNGTETASNSHNIRLRHAYVTLNAWTVGQTYSSFISNSMPDTIYTALDLAFVRQPLIKYTSSFNQIYLDISLENPETKLLNLDTNQTTLYNDDRFFDSVIRIRWEKKKFKASISSILRYLSVEKNSEAISTVAWGFNSSLKYSFDHGDYIQTAFAQGKGIGRYLSLGYFNAGELNNQAIELLPLQSGHLSYTHKFTKNLRSTLLWSHIESQSSQELQFLKPERVEASHINLRYTPLEKTLITLEYIHGKREQLSQTTQKLDRIMASFSYIF